MNIIQCGDRNLTSVPREIPMDATAVYLDSNQMTKLGPEIFLGRSKVTTLMLNSSHITGMKYIRISGACSDKNLLVCSFGVGEETLTKNVKSYSFSNTIPGHMNYRNFLPIWGQCKAT